MSLPKIENISPCRRVPAGGCFGVFSPSSPAKKEKVNCGNQFLGKQGYYVRELSVPDKDSNLNPFSAGSISFRVKQVEELVEDSGVDVLIAARGGYGVLELLPHLDFEIFKKNKKLLIGFSDLTALLVNVTARSGIVTIHGPHLAVEFARAEQEEACSKSVAALMELFVEENREVSYPLDFIVEGQSQGRILAGNLLTLCTLLGTPFDVDYSGCILVIEDIAEAPYRIHRLLTQLLLAGKFDNLAGLVFGEFSKAEEQSGPSVEDAINGFVAQNLKDKKFPIARNIEIGHSGLNFPLPIGVRAFLGEGALTFSSSDITSSGA